MAFIYGSTVPQEGALTSQVYIKASTIQAFTATSTSGAGRPTKLGTVSYGDWATTLGNFTLIGVMERGSILQRTSGDNIEINDDTVVGRNYNVTFEGTLLEVTDANLIQLRSSFLNKQCDILLWDCSKTVEEGAPYTIGYGLRIKMDVISENMGLYKCNLTATANEPYPGDVFVFDELGA